MDQCVSPFERHVAPESKLAFLDWVGVAVLIYSSNEGDLHNKEISHHVGRSQSSAMWLLNNLRVFAYKAKFRALPLETEGLEIIWS